MRNYPDDQYHTVLIADILQGNTNAFEVLLDRYQNIVAKIVLRHVPHDRALEVAEEAFVRAFQSLRQFKGIQPFKHWLSKIAVRTCYDFWRDYYKHPEIPISSLSEAGQKAVQNLLAHQSEAEFVQQAEKQEARELLHWALGQLTADDRMLLTITYFDGYSMQEAAEFLDWSVSNVKVRSHRARQQLRDILGNLISDA